MKLSAIAAVSANGVIGNGLDIPWKVKGEQLLFKALTYNQYLLIGRKTFDTIGPLPDRKFAVITRNPPESTDPNVHYYNSIESALTELREATDHVFIAGGGEIYHALMHKIDTLHLSLIDTEVQGDIFFPAIPQQMRKVFQMPFTSNIDYTYQIWTR